ncbi:FAD:protein FMN transferase [Desulfobulbus alkaliphilus]|uniref:FAD:protein FMN transferase n=1 Tax=Desulfobulbus alkaliphilus TaxID=869814 RepID=UPI001964C0EC|nr:FAD:protein FMN transferase [Desulfobulbus alkaliphilus]MBM9537505.1 FAD:protein FMN transferase [Desulfobulbus alkaliphilus]
MSVHHDSRPRIGRRRFLTILALTGVAAGFYGFGALRPNPGEHTIRQSRIMMGTQINLIVHGPDVDQCLQATRDTFARMETLEHIFSRYRAESALARLNATGALSAAPAEFLEVLDLADHISETTEGAFDITVLPLLQLYAHNQLPEQDQLTETLRLVDYRAIERRGARLAFTRPNMGITLDGIAKGYIVDQGVATLNSNGFADVYVEAGGDLMVTGNKPGDQPWRVGVRPPRAYGPETMPVISTFSPLAVATSGDYMQAFSDDLRHHHILDPRTGMSPLELASATVTAPSVALADGLATAAMVLGPKQALTVLEKYTGCEGLLISKDLHQYRTTGFQG